MKQSIQVIFVIYICIYSIFVHLASEIQNTWVQKALRKGFAPRTKLTQDMGIANALCPTHADLVDSL